MNDGQVLAYGAKYNLRYGPIRVWGTYGFIVAQLIVAVLFLYIDNIRWIFLPWILFAIGMAATTWKMESLPSGLKRGELLKGLKLIADRSFATFCMGCVMLRIAMMGYYTFFSVYLLDLGLPFSVAALAWCLGPISEILVIQYADRLVDWFGVKGLLLWALGGAVIRLSLLAAAPPTWVILASQSLHALTFGAMHVAGILYANHHFPSTMRASGQTAFNAIVIGLSGAVGNLLAGFLYDAKGPQWMLGCLAAVALTGFAAVLVFLRPVKIKAA